MLPLIDTIGDINSNNPGEAIRQIVEYIRQLERQLYMILSNLDSSNMSGISLDDIEFKSENGSSITKDKITLQGKNGEKIELGYDEKKKAFICDLGNITADSITVKKLLVKGKGKMELRSEPDNNICLKGTDKDGYKIIDY